MIYRWLLLCLLFLQHRQLPFRLHPLTPPPPRAPSIPERSPVGAAPPQTIQNPNPNLDAITSATRMTFGLGHHLSLSSLPRHPGPATAGAGRGVGGQRVLVLTV
jgi:hypothetical protein